VDDVEQAAFGPSHSPMLYPGNVWRLVVLVAVPGPSLITPFTRS